MNLTNYGLTETRRTQAAGMTLGRVTGQHHQTYTVVTEAGPLDAQVAGRFAYLAVDPSDFPTVGDWVLLRPDTTVIERVLPRTSQFTRQAAGRTAATQVVAVNVDVVLLCMGLDANFNLSRLTRYLAVATASGAAPVVVLTKADAAADLPGQLAATQATAGVVPVVTVSAGTGDVTAVASRLTAGQTVALIGSSGVGKTTLMNALAGRELGATGAVRAADAHGRHTTTSRELVVLPSGVIMLDTPGMRELAVADADVGGAFADVLALAAQCKFRDCTHGSEPGCAVQAAIAAGTLAADRLTAYQTLAAEGTANELRGRARENAKIARMFGSKKQMAQKMKAARQRRQH